MSIISTTTKNSWKRKVTFTQQLGRGSLPKSEQGLSAQRERAPPSPLGAQYLVHERVQSTGCERAPSVCQGRFRELAREPIIENSGSGLAESQEEGARIMSKVSKCGLSLSKEGESWWEQSWQALSQWCPQAQRVPCDQWTSLARRHLFMPWLLVMRKCHRSHRASEMPHPGLNGASWDVRVSCKYC